MSEHKHDIDLLVSIDVVSASATIGQLSVALGMKPTIDISHEMGSSRARGGVWSLTIWRLDSGCPSSAPIAEHIGALLKIFPAKALRNRSRLPPDVRIDLNIGVMATFFCHTLEIPSDYLRRLGEAGIDVTVAFYATCTEVEGKRNEKTRRRRSRR